MKKITLILFTALAFTGFAQQKSTGVVALGGGNMTVNLTLDSTTSIATLTLTGSNDRYFALQFGSFSQGMAVGTDLVYYNGTTLVDAKQNGTNNFPIPDPTQNWTLVSNNDNTPLTGLRTIVYTRPFNTSDANDYTFNYSDTTIDLAWATRNSANFAMANHGFGPAFRGLNLDTPLTTLGTEDFSLNASQIYPNPSNGAFLIKTKTSLEKVNIYSQTGAFVKTIDVKDGLDTEVNVTGLPTGIYLLELINATNKGWKKVIVK